MPRIVELKEVDGKLAVLLDMLPTDPSPVTFWTEAEKEAALAAERKACVEIVVIGYRNDWTHAMIVDEIHARSTPTT